MNAISQGFTDLKKYYNISSRNEKFANVLIVGSTIGSAMVVGAIVGAGIGPSLVVGTGVLGCYLAVRHYTKDMNPPFIIKLIASVAIATLVGHAAALMLTVAGGMTFAAAIGMATHMGNATALTNFIAVSLARRNYLLSTSIFF
jgi:hypothetical protein